MAAGSNTLVLQDGLSCHSKPVAQVALPLPFSSSPLDPGGRQGGYLTGAGPRLSQDFWAWETGTSVVLFLDL